MPELVDLKETPNGIGPSEQSFHFNGADMGEVLDINLVNRTFDEYDMKRRMHEQRWLNADGLYNGNVPVRKWEGSDALRSSIPNNFSFDHVEGTQGKLEEVFMDNPQWFQVEATADSSPQDAKDQQEYLDAILNTPSEDLSRGPVLDEARQSWHQIDQYGEGAMLGEWKGYPSWRFIDIRDIYVDPLCPSPNVEDARSIVVRRWLTIEECNAMLDIDGFTIPNPNVLWTLSQQNQAVAADTNKQMSEQSRGVYSPTPVTETQPNIHLNQIELLCYYDKKRVIWTLGRKYRVFTATNDLGFYPIVMAPCRFNPAHLYGIGLPESVQWQQRYAEALLNNMLDDCHLRQDPPIVAGRNVDSTKIRMRPGNRMEAGDPKEVIAMDSLGTMPTDIMPVVDWIIEAGAKRNGMNDLASSGVAGAPGNVRTRAGVAAQMSGADLRIRHIVHNIEYFMLSQLLYKSARMMAMYTNPEDVILGKFSDLKTGKPIKAACFHKPVRYKMTTGTRMMQRQEAKELVPFIGSTLLNGPMMEGLAAQGETFNYSYLSDLVELVIGRKARLIIPMSEEQKKARQQPSPQMIGEQQKFQAETQVKMALADKETQRDIAVAQIQKQPDGSEQFKAEAARQEMAAKQQDRQVQFQSKVADAQLKQQVSQQKARTDAMLGQQKLAMEAQKMQMEQERMNMEHQNNLRSLLMQRAMGPTQPMNPQQGQPQQP